MKKLIFFIALVVVFSAMSEAAESATPIQSQEKIPFKQTWSGKDLSEDLMSAAPRELYITDAASWAKLWQAWRGRERLPVVNFDKELIVFCTTNSPNSCGINLSLDEQGDLKITSESTLIGSDAKTFNYQIGLIERGGIKSIGGKPIAQSAHRSQSQEKIPFKQTWSGSELLNDLQSAAPPNLYIADVGSWKKLWQAWRGGEPLPKVDFDKELIVFCTTSSPNSCGINLSLDKQGDLNIMPVTTLIASDSKKFNYQIALIDRTGIKSIGGKTITKNSSAGEAASGNAANAVVEQLKQATQELLDAIAPGNKPVWQKYLAEGSIYADEEGKVWTKDELIKELNPLPKGYIGTIKMGDPKVLIQDNVIVLSHLDREELELYGQKIVTYFHMTQTWARQADGQWQLVSSQVMAIPNERKPVAIDPKKLDLYVGQYELDAQTVYTVTREGDKLYGQRSGRAKEELLSLCDNTFYKKGVWRGEKVFEKDGNGKVINLLDRRENNDLVWKKIK